MKRTNVFTDQQLTEALKRERVGGKFLVLSKHGKSHDRTEQNRVYHCASCAGRKIAMRKLFGNGWKATIIE